MGEPALADDYTVIWRPQAGPQTALLCCPVFEVFYGGARGGGKSDGVLGEWASHASRYGEHASGLIVRRERAQLYDLVERSRQIYLPLGARFVDNVWRFPDGARLRFAYLERDQDADAYQGHSYTRVYVEEAGTFPHSKPIFKLMATLRSGHGVPCGMRLTGNPGGPGHQWVRARYIDPAPLGWKIMRSEFVDPFTGDKVSRDRVYIPSRLSDNHYLGAEYVANLHLSGDAELVRAWLEGDWSVVTGAYFPEFSVAKHVVAPFEIPKYWARIRAMDWGSAKPFCVLWGAVADGTTEIPRGWLVIYREWYGWSGEPNVGCKMPAESVGHGVKDLESGERLADAVLDPSAFASDGGPSIAERLDLGSRRADNARVASGGRMGGWDQVRARLDAQDCPGVVIFSTCSHLIRTLPALQHDSHRPEDVDTESEDHAPDAFRYLCMARPVVRLKPKSEPRKFETDMTFNELVKRRTQKRLAES